MGDVGEGWRDADRCRWEAASRRSRHQHWRDRGATDRRAGKPIEAADRIDVKRYRQEWRRGWRDEDDLIAQEEKRTSSFPTTFFARNAKKSPHR